LQGHIVLALPEIREPQVCIDIAAPRALTRLADTPDLAVIWLPSSPAARAK
jgi:hypothetical protein